MRYPTLSVSLAALVAFGGATVTSAQGLLPVQTMPSEQLIVVSTSSARAFDHIRAAREQIESRQLADARQEVAQARTLLTPVIEASPSTRIQNAIAAVLTQLDDPTTTVSMDDLAPIYAEIAAAGDDDAHDAAKRYVERARYQLFHQNRDAAARELVAAASRVPYGEIDGPIGATWKGVNDALIALYDRDLEGADAILAAAEGEARSVVQIASGGHDDILGDVAAPEPMAEEITTEEEVMPKEPMTEAPAAEEAPADPMSDEGGEAPAETNGSGV